MISNCLENCLQPKTNKSEHQVCLGLLQMNRHPGCHGDDRFCYHGGIAAVALVNADELVFILRYSKWLLAEEGNGGAPLDGRAAGRRVDPQRSCIAAAMLRPPLPAPPSQTLAMERQHPGGLQSCVLNCFNLLYY